MHFSEQELKEKFDKLPDDLKEVMSSPEVYEKMQSIGKKYELLIDKQAALEDEVSSVLLGLVPASKFEGRVRSALGVSSEMAAAIVSEVNEGIFKAIRESLMKMQTEVPDEEPEASGPAAENGPVDRNAVISEIDRTEKLVSDVENFVGNKLTEPSKSTAERINITNDRPFHVDPYREPVE